MIHSGNENDGLSVRHEWIFLLIAFQYHRSRISGEPLAIPLLRAAIFSNNGGREKGNKGMLWGQTEVSCGFFCTTCTSVMPDLIRHPASPSPWAERALPVAQTRAGWIPAQGRNDGRRKRREQPGTGSLPHPYSRAIDSDPRPHRPRRLADAHLRLDEVDAIRFVAAGQPVQ